MRPETDALVYNDAVRSWRSEPCAFWLDAARDQIEALDALIGRPDSDMAATSISDGRAVLVICVDADETPTAIGIIFATRDPARDRDTFFAVISSADPMFDFGPFVKRLERAALTNGLRHLSIASSGRRGLEGYEVVEGNGRRVIEAVRTLPVN